MDRRRGLLERRSCLRGEEEEEEEREREEEVELALLELDYMDPLEVIYGTRECPRVFSPKTSAQNGAAVKISARMRLSPNC